MTMKLLETVCGTLKTANLTRSEQHFCEQWLAKSACYMRTLRFNNLEPSTEALATLGSKLGYYANELARRDDDTCAYWSDQLTKLRRETQAALELRVRARWQSVCDDKSKQHEKSL